MAASSAKQQAEPPHSRCRRGGAKEHATRRRAAVAVGGAAAQKNTPQTATLLSSPGRGGGASVEEAVYVPHGHVGSYNTWVGALETLTTRRPLALSHATLAKAVGKGFYAAADVAHGAATVAASVRNRCSDRG